MRCRGEEVSSNDWVYLQNELSFLGDIYVIRHIIEIYSPNNMEGIHPESPEAKVCCYLCFYYDFATLLTKYKIDPDFIKKYISLSLARLKLNSTFESRLHDIIDVIKSYIIYYVAKYQSLKT